MADKPDLTDANTDKDPKGKGSSSNSSLKKEFQVNSLDNLESYLISKPLNNYNAWSRAMRIVLGAKKKYRYVIGRIKKPYANAENYEDLEEVDLIV